MHTLALTRMNNTHVRRHIYTHTNTQTHTYTHTHTHKHTHTRARAHTHTRTHARTHAHTRAHTHTRARTRTHKTASPRSILGAGGEHDVYPESPVLETLSVFFFMNMFMQQERDCVKEGESETGRDSYRDRGREICFGAT